MPMPACRLGYQWLLQHPAKIKITKPRSTKLGDFRVRDPEVTPVISVNGDLNPYAFTITFAHEIAHMMDWYERKTLANPHGNSWKAIYVGLLRQLLEHDVFPPDFVPVIQRHIHSPKAASCSDPALLDQLRKYDTSGLFVLKELPMGAHFKLNGTRLFERGELLRTRYRCVEMRTGRIFLVHGQSEVELVDKKS